MLRQILSVTTLSAVVAASVLLPSAARAHGTYQECLNEAGAVYAQSIKNGTPRDAAAVQFASDVAACKVEFKR